MIVSLILHTSGFHPILKIYIKTQIHLARCIASEEKKWCQWVHSSECHGVIKVCTRLYCGKMQHIEDKRSFKPYVVRTLVQKVSETTMNF